MQDMISSLIENILQLSNRCFTESPIIFLKINTNYEVPQSIAHKILLYLVTIFMVIANSFHHLYEEKIMYIITLYINFYAFAN